MYLYRICILSEFMTILMAFILLDKKLGMVKFQYFKFQLCNNFVIIW